MNALRRKEIAAAQELLQQALEIIQQVGADEREAYDNLSESLQNGERGEAIDASATACEDAESSLEEVISYLEQATGQ